MSEKEQKRNSKIFYICANDTFIFGLDHDGYVWSRPATESDAEWQCLGKPDANKAS